jgi:hypothetical protein
MAPFWRENQLVWRVKKRSQKEELKMQARVKSKVQLKDSIHFK